MYTLLDEESVRLVWAHARLRRIRRKQRALRAWFVAERLKPEWQPPPKPLPPPLPPPQPAKPWRPVLCDCFCTSAEVGTYADMMNAIGVRVTRTAVCAEAWANLLKELRYLPTRPTQYLTIETGTGPIEVHHNPLLHAVSNEDTKAQAQAITRALRDL